MRNTNVRERDGGAMCMGSVMVMNERLSPDGGGGGFHLHLKRREGGDLTRASCSRL